MYAAWLDGATEADIHGIKQAMERRPVVRVAIPDQRAAISAVNAGTNYPKLIVIRPPESPEFGSSLAVGKTQVTQVSETIRKLSGGEGGIARGCAARPSLAFGTAVANAPASCADVARRLVEPKGSNPASTIRHENQKGARGPLFDSHKWRRGWDSNPRAGITRPSDFESAPL